MMRSKKGEGLKSPPFGGFRGQKKGRTSMCLIFCKLGLYVKKI
jgi:hypothetical protein